MAFEGCNIHRFHKHDARGSGDTCPDTQKDKEKHRSIVVKSTDVGTRCWIQIPEKRLREEQNRGAKAGNSTSLYPLPKSDLEK